MARKEPLYPHVPKRVHRLSRVRPIIDEMEKLLRSDPDEFYRRKNIFRQAMDERKKGKKIKTLPEFTLEELEEILREIDMLYR